MSARPCLAVVSAALLMAGCAAAPEPQPPVVAQARDPRIEALLAMVDARLAADPGIAPRGLEVSVTRLDDTGPQLRFDTRFTTPERRGRDAQDFTVYVSCQPEELAACATMMVGAARALNNAR